MSFPANHARSGFRVPSHPTPGGGHGKRRILLGRVVTPRETFLKGAVCIQGNTIICVGSEADAPRDPKDPAERVQGWITPGLIDLHIHGAGGRDLMEPDPEAIRAVSRTLAAHGTTSFLATSVVRRKPKENRHLEVAAELAQEKLDGAQVLGIHVEGPFVNPARGGLIRPDRIWPPDRGSLKEILQLTKGSLRMMTLAPELKGALELLSPLTDAGAIGSMGHTEATFDQARQGFSQGIRHVTHLYNAMRGLHHREPGALGAVLVDHGVTTQLICDGVHVHPTVLSLTRQLLSPEAIVLITDALPSSGLPDGVYAYDGRPYEAKAGSAWHHADDGDRLFGTTLLLDEMVRRAMTFMGVNFAQAIAMASLNPARTLGLEKRIGTLAPGAQADLVIWDEELRVKETILRGQTIWKRQRGLTPNFLKQKGQTPFEVRVFRERD